MLQATKPQQGGKPKRNSARQRGAGDNDGSFIVVVGSRNRAEWRKPTQAERSGGLAENANGASRNYSVKGIPTDRPDGAAQCSRRSFLSLVDRITAP